MQFNQGTTEERNVEINETLEEINGVVDNLDMPPIKAHATKDFLNSSRPLIEKIEKINQLDMPSSVAKYIEEKLHYLDALNNPYNL